MSWEKSQQTVERTLWAEYRDGFFVQLRYLTRAQLRHISERCKTTGWDKTTHEKIEKADQAKWAALFAREVFVDWKGLMPAVLRVMVNLAEYPTEEQPFSVEKAEYLLLNAYDFDLWAQALSADLAAFVAWEEAEQIKKSAPSPAAS